LAVRVHPAVLRLLHAVRDLEPSLLSVVAGLARRRDGRHVVRDPGLGAERAQPLPHGRSVQAASGGERPIGPSSLRDTGVLRRSERPTLFSVASLGNSGAIRADRADPAWPSDGTTIASLRRLEVQLPLKRWPSVLTCAVFVGVVSPAVAHAQPVVPFPPYGIPLESIGSAARLQVTPRETEVYVDGRLAGKVGDFEGFGKKLDLPSGSHEVTLYLEGYRVRRDTL